jgi:eukaryotic-like serine/threonine-protein kinase
MLIRKERMQQEIWFHKYRIIKLLGRGGTAKVYLAEHVKLNSFRAIKCISKNHPLYDLQRKESQILKTLKHSCIPIVYDIEEDEEGSYIVEQYLEGDTLRDYVEQKGILQENIIIHFALQLCDIIQYLHSIPKPILYLDIKPENIIVTGTTLKLIDFGSAIFFDDLKERQKFFGTRGYAAPELYQNDKPDERSDVYGIGMLLYYMATGVLIQADCNGFDHIDRISNCSKQLKNIINHCLKFNPSQRYASVTLLSKHLSAVKQKDHGVKESGQSVRIAVAGAQPRIGVTHLSFRLCRYFISRRNTCLYQEKNNSGCVWSMKNRYEGLYRKEDGVYSIEGIPMLPEEHIVYAKEAKYHIQIQDYGCLTMDNLTDFLSAEIKILLLGAKDWELQYAEQVIDMVAEYKDVVYLFNYLGGRDFLRVMKSMKQRNCYRMPYEPDPFSKPTQKSELELFLDIARTFGI